MKAKQALHPEPKPQDHSALHHNIERWLMNTIGPAYDALKADPTRAITTDQIRARLATEFAHTPPSPSLRD